MAFKNTRVLIIVYLPQEWMIYHRRPHWLAMAKHARILIVEPPAGILTAWLRPKRLLHYFKNRGLRTGEDGILFFRPLLLATPGFDFLIPLLAKIDRLFLRRKLRKILSGLKSDYDNLFTFVVHLYQAHLAKLFDDEICFFEVTDQHLLPHGHHELNRKHWYTRKAMRTEDRLLKRIDVVISSSRLHCEDLQDKHSIVHYLPNCADYKHFSKSRDVNLAIPDDLDVLPLPRLGFIGYVNHLLDYELINLLAEADRKWSIVIIGSEQRITNVHKDRQYQKSKSQPNVYYLGFRDYEKLPAYLKGFDVSLLPFRLNEWMRYSAPNKTYQYLASGKPVVSTNFPEMQIVNDVVLIGEDHQQFIEHVKAALTDKSSDNTESRQRVAREYSTEARAEKVIKIINDTIENKPIALV